MVLGAMAGIAVFAYLNVKLLVFNLRKFAAFRRSDAYEAFAKSNAGSQVLAMPLALAMSVNVGFILGLTFVPGLWSIVEYMFPAALPPLSSSASSPFANSAISSACACIRADSTVRPTTPSRRCCPPSRSP
jgi:hypothetical protein